MRILKNRKGEFYIDDAPMELSGASAKQFLKEINSNVSSNPNHARILADCQRIARMNNISREDLEHALSCMGFKLISDTSESYPIFSQDGSVERYTTDDSFVKVTCETCSNIKEKYEIK